MNDTGVYTYFPHYYLSFCCYLLCGIVNERSYNNFNKPKPYSINLNEIYNFIQHIFSHVKVNFFNILPSV